MILRQLRSRQERVGEIHPRAQDDEPKAHGSPPPEHPPTQYGLHYFWGWPERFPPPVSTAVGGSGKCTGDCTSSTWAEAGLSQ